MIKIYYRGGCDSNMPANKTALDIINYERDILGNKDIKVIKEVDLRKIKSENLVWVTTDKKSAKQYGKVGQEEYINPKIIARDSDNGILIEVKKGVKYGISRSEANY